MKFRCMIAFALGAAAATGVLSRIPDHEADLAGLRGEAARLSVMASEACSGVVNGIREKFSLDGTEEQYFPAMATEEIPEEPIEETEEIEEMTEEIAEEAPKETTEKPADESAEETADCVCGLCRSYTEGES